MLTITKSFEFEAGHFLPYYVGKCHNLHGHSYKMDVTISGEIIKDIHNEKVGMIMDFNDLSRIVKELIIDDFDHTCLNNLFTNPTAEVMVCYIFEILKKCLPESVKLVSVRLWETRTSYAEYKE